MTPELGKIVQEMEQATVDWSPGVIHQTAKDIKAVLASQPQAQWAVRYVDEPTGEMWSVGRRAFVEQADLYRAVATTDEAAIHADHAPRYIFNRMLAAARQTSNAESVRGSLAAPLAGVAAESERKT